MARQLNFFDEDPDRFFECLKYEDLLNGFQRPDDQDGGEADAVPIPYASLKVLEMIDADAEAFAEYLQDYAKAAPDAELPSLAQLAEHMAIGECTPEALREANARLRSLLGGGDPGIPALLMPVHGEDGAPVSICGLAGGTPLRLAEVLSFVDDAVELRSRILRPLRRDHTGPFPPALETRPPPVLNPLSPLVRSWRNRPYPVEPSQRLTKRIIPAKLAQADPATDNRAGRLFSLAAHVPLGSQIALPGFGAEICGPALPLALYDLGNGPSSRSQAAPLALRVFIEGILAVPQAERGTGRPVAYEVTLRAFLAWFWPDRTPSPSEYWPALNATREALFNCLVPLIDPDTGRGQLRQVVSIGAIPRGSRVLDDVVRIVVDLPKDSQNGPQLPDSIRSWGNQSAPAYRALINLAFHWHNPGQTHFPVGKRRSGKGKFWARSNDPDRYPEFSDQQLIELCYPTSADTNRRKLLLRARQTIARLDAAGELRIFEGKILPPAPSRNNPPSDSH